MSSILLIVRSDRRTERTLQDIQNIARATRQGIRRGFFNLGKDLKSEANREILRKPKSGRVYIIRTPSGRRRRHVASAPGETHANLTGKLRRSIGWQIHGSESMDFGYGVGGRGTVTRARNAAPHYAPFVEFGTRNMEERPSLLNAINAQQRNAERDFLNGIKLELERAGL